MTEVEALQSIAKTFESTQLTLESIKFMLFGINLALWLILFCKDCHGNTLSVTEAIKELTNHLRSRK